MFQVSTQEFVTQPASHHSTQGFVIITGQPASQLSTQEFVSTIGQGVNLASNSGVQGLVVSTPTVGIQPVQ